MPLSSAARQFLAQQAAKNPVKTTTQTSTTPVAPVATLTANTADAALAAALNPPLVTVDITTNTTTTSTQSQVGLQFGSSLSTKTVSIGESVVDTSVINTIRSKEIVFSSYHLKPLTRLYAFFDNVNVDKFIFTSTRIVLNKTVHTNRTKEFSSTNKTVKVLFAKGSTIFIKEVFTNPSLSTNTHLVVGNTFTWDSITYTITEVSQTTALETDNDGYVAGTFIIPNTAEVSFKTGTRSFLICDSFNNNAAEINTAAEFAYYASGMTQSKQATTLATRINQVTIDPILKSSSTEASPVTATTTSSSHESPLVITIDNAAPIITSYSPTRGKTDVSITTNIVITFNKTIVAGTGAITLMKPNGTVIASTNSISGSTLTITPSASLSNNTLYKVVLDNGCVKDTSNNLFAGSSDYSFTTLALPVPVLVPEYTIVPNKSLAFEGEDVTFTVTATNDTTSTFYWSGWEVVVLQPDGTTTLEPHPELVGTVTLFNGYGTFIAKYPIEGTETNDEYYSIKLAKTADMAVILKTSSTVTIRPLPKIPAPSASYTIESDKTSIYENQTVNFTIKTTEISDNTPLYWSASGTTITAADFTQNILTGSVIIVNNRAYINLTAADDADTSEEVFIISLYSDSGRAILKTSSSSISIVPLASVNPTYAIESSRNNIYEGESVKCTVTTTNVADNTTLYWSAAGTNITASDFTQATLTGTVTVINNTGYFNLTAADDANTLNEDFIVSLWTNSGRTLNERKTRPVTILQQITVSEPTYSISSDKTTINENEQVTFTVTTTNLSNTTLYWAASGTNINAADFTQNSLIGTVSIVNNTGTFSLTSTNDLDLLETFIISLYSNIGRTTLKTISDSVNIVPLKSPEIVWEITTAVDTLYSGISTSNTELISLFANVAAGTQVYWSVQGVNITAEDFTQKTLTGSFTTKAINITGKTGNSLVLTASTDADLLETFVVNFRTGSTLGPIVARSKLITIIPVSPKPTYTISTKTNSVVEGATITFDVVTENVGTATLFYNLNGTGITTADFDGGLTGTVSIVDDKGSFTKTVAINAD